jgi:hypothetical protein
VRSFAAAWDTPLDILVNNAGVMAIQNLTLTGHGHEMQFATNHLGHFTLALALHDALAAAAGARIVSVSSSGHLLSPVVFDDLHYRFRSYDPFGAYGQSKTANVLFAVEASRRWAIDGIIANAVHPGGIATGLQRHVGGEQYMRRAAERFRQAGSRLKTPAQGAATSVLVATSPHLDGIGGRYFEDCNLAPVIQRRGDAGLGGVACYALDEDNAARLWDVSLDLIGGARPALPAAAERSWTRVVTCPCPTTRSCADVRTVGSRYRDRASSMNAPVSSAMRLRAASVRSRSGPCPVSTASPCTVDQIGYSMP